MRHRHLIWPKSFSRFSFAAACALYLLSVSSPCHALSTDRRLCFSWHEAMAVRFEPTRHAERVIKALEEDYHRLQGPRRTISTETTMWKEVHARISERRWLMPQGLKGAIELPACHVCTPSRLIVHQLVAQAYDEGAFEWFQATFDLRFFEKVQNQFKPRDRILAINYVRDRREKLLSLTVHAV